MESGQEVGRPCSLVQCGFCYSQIRYIKGGGTRTPRPRHCRHQKELVASGQAGMRDMRPGVIWSGGHGPEVGARRLNDTVALTMPP